MFSTLDALQPDVYEELNDDQKKKIVDYLIAWYWATYISSSKELAELDDGHMVPLNVSKWAIKKVKEICNYCMSYVQWQIVVAEATYDEEWKELTACEYNTVPTTSTELKANALEYFTTCTKIWFDYAVDKWLENKTVDWTLDSLKLYLSNQE